MAMIRRVTIHRLRNVAPGCTFELHPGLNVLLGQNGTGKTTLLQWMADFLSGELQSWSHEPYRVEVEMEAAVEQERARLRMLVDNEISELPRDPGAQHGRDPLTSLLSEPPRTSLATARLTIEYRDQSYEIQQRRNHLSVYANDARLVGFDGDLPIRGSSNSFAGMISRAVVALKQNNDVQTEAARNQAQGHLVFVMRDVLSSYPAPIRCFDESLGFFRRIVPGPESEAQAVLHPFRTSMMLRLIPAELSLRIGRRLGKTESDVQTLSFSSEEVQGFLATAVQRFQHRSATVQLELLEKDAQGSRYGNLRFTFHRQDGNLVGHDALSQGQKRLLSFLYYLALHPRLVLADELANGLHHGWIEACLEQIGDRQGILTSQNPLLLDHMSFDSADEVRQRFILCCSDRKDGGEQLVWRNPDQEESESVFRAYRAGIQPIGAILVDKGLW
jgi:ABC-type molybdenum transport system ATPase subunit/photorepair protein PhrA